jgi:hypothetical protein
MRKHIADPIDFVNSDQMAPNGRTVRENFKNWFGSSTLRDDDGTPILMYHGTSHNFTEFDPSKGAQGVIWVTANREEIEAGEIGADSAGIIMTLFVTIKNPAGWDEYEKYSIDEIESMGYDGIILPDDGTLNAIVFESKQIKSATNNSGLFDPEASDITDAALNKKPEAVRKPR